MTDRTSTGDARDNGDPPADEERARAYAEGFGEGIRTALKDILQHVSEGYTASELRLLVQGRLARVEDEVELRRRSMLGPPRTRADVLFANGPPPPRSWSPGGGTVHVVPRQSYLVNEPHPSRALALVAAVLADFPRTILLSLHPPALPGLPAARRVELSLTSASAPGEVARPIPLGQIGGRLREAMAGGALVYTDALDFLLAEEPTDTMVQFAAWLTDEARSTGSAVVVSIDAAALDLKQFTRIQRTFSTQA
ncbi:MAG: hypothetical protein WAN74_03525 [Thermoplasmata archaeon]